MSINISKEQILYGKILNSGMLVGLISLFAIFIFYISGIIQPLLPLDKIQEYWKMSVHNYLKESHINPGWDWVNDIGYGDMLCLLPISFLSLLTVVCYASMLPEFIRRKDKIFTTLVITEIIVLLIAASGFLAAGAH